VNVICEEKKKIAHETEVFKFLTKCSFVIVYRLVKDTAASIFGAEDARQAVSCSKISVVCTTQHGTTNQKKKYIKNVGGKIR